MIKVLFFIHDLSGGGAEKVLVNLVNNMDKSKFDITILTMFDKGINKQYLIKDIKYKYVFKKVFRGNQHILKLFSPSFLYKKIIKEEYDVAISYMQGATTRIIGGCNNMEIKKINWVHNEMTKKKLSHSYRSYKEYLKIYKKYDATVFVAQSAKDIFEKETGLKKNNIVKYNTVETKDIIKNAREDLNLIKFDSNILNLITIGSLTQQKGYDRLLRIVKRLFDNGYKFHLYILGIGPLKDELVRFTEDNAIVDYVTFLGYQENPHKFLSKADLFVCSSYHEGYSTVVTESLIVGTPVITTFCSGMKEMLGSNNEYGKIVENNENSLYNGLIELLEDRYLLEHYREKAAERSNYFDTKKTVNEVERMLLEI